MTSPLHALPFENTYAHLGESFGTEVRPTPLPAPYPVAFNAELGEALGIDARDPSWVEVTAGARLPERSRPFAMVYSGHQFGVYVPRLGDGRALLLGELADAAGNRWELHLKGGGTTPYSRGGDGRAVLRSTVREYLACEALHALGVPTTRALCLVGSELPVYREEVETAASLIRVAPSFVRFGTFEYFSHTNRHAELALLADHVIAKCFPPLTALPEAERRQAMFTEAVARTAALMADWQAVGFCHGVMNTDNLSITGHTLDYGPYAFVEAFDPAFNPNHSDERGRYSLNQQPAIGLWNLTRLAEALLPLLPEEKLLETLETYGSQLEAAYTAKMRRKLGLVRAEERDWELIQGALGLLKSQRADYSRFFRALSRFPSDPEPALAELVDPPAGQEWLETYRARLSREDVAPEQRRAAMDAVNPKYVLRTHLAEEVIRSAADAKDFAPLHRLAAVLRRPFDEQPEHERLSHASLDSGHVVLSCSS